MSALSKDYSAEFDCKKYLQTFYNGLEKNRGMKSFHLRQRHDFFEKYSCKWDRKAAKMLEFGGGPVIAGLISAVPHVQEVVFAAYTESERKEVELWKEQTGDAYNWSPFFEYVVGEIESKTGDNVWQEREALLRSRIKITSCDITQEYPIGIAEEQMPFSVICTSLCLEVACKSYSEYKTAVKRLGKLLKPGGYLVMFVAERESFYRVGQRKWFTLPLTLVQIKEAIHEAGFETLVVERDPAPIHHLQNQVDSDSKAHVFVAAYKVEF